MQNSQSSKISGIVASSTSQVPIRASRKSEWLQSVLAHLYDPDPRVENEIVVLATGIDQYLQEIFHHLAYRSGCDLVTAQDFRLLCGILGIFDSCDSAKEKGDADEIAGIFSGLPSQLHFREFHARLCGHFSLREGNGKPNVRLPITEETEHIEREIRLRCPRVRRRKCVSFDLAKDSLPERRRISKLASILKLENLHHCAGESDEEKLIAVADSDQGGAAIQQAEIENASLRELVEDLRAALQTSDARCLALEVALQRERGAWSSEGKGEELNGAKVKERPAVSSHVLRGTRDLLRELELIRASRDGQLEEAMRFNQRLEAELRASNEESRWLEGAVLRLQRENRQMKRRAEEARSALARGLNRVREIQEQAQLVPSLQARVRELEADRERVRCQCNCGANRDELDGPDFMTPEPHHMTPLRHSPTGRDESCNKVEDGFQRAVEGRASSDEEEEGSGRGEGQCCLVEVKRMLNRLHCCSKGCQNSAARQLLISQTCFHANPHSGISATMELGGRGPKSHTHPEENESDQEKSRQEEVEMLRMEMRMVETERVRLSLLEDKLTDALTLLLQLRAKNISRRALGNIFMDTLDVCGKAGHGPSHSLQVIDTLCRQMLTCELLREGAGSTMDAGTQRGVTNPLLISC